MPTNVLVVDDHYDSVVLLSRVLAQGGYAVWWERSCREAKLVAATHRIDVLLSEIALPDGDGCQLLADLRETYPQMHAIAYTSSDSENDRSRMMAAGFQAIVTKPTETKEILRTIDDAIAGRAPNPAHRLNPNIFIACM